MILKIILKPQTFRFDFHKYILAENKLKIQCYSRAKKVMVAETNLMLI